MGPRKMHHPPLSPLSPYLPNPPYSPLRRSRHQIASQQHCELRLIETYCLHVDLYRMRLGPCPGVPSMMVNVEHPQDLSNQHY